jgi:hypothetical protein
VPLKKRYILDRFIAFFLDGKGMSIMTKAGELVKTNGVHKPDADPSSSFEMDTLGEKL